MVNLEELMLREEDRIDRKVINVESNHEENKDKKKDDDMEILEAYSQASKQAQVE